MHTQDTHTCMHAYSHTIPTIRVQCILIAVIVAVMLDKQMLGRPLSRCGDIWRRRHALRPRLENLQSNRIWGIAGTFCGIRSLFPISAKKKVTWGVGSHTHLANSGTTYSIGTPCVGLSLGMARVHHGAAAHRFGFRCLDRFVGLQTALLVGPVCLWTPAVWHTDTTPCALSDVRRYAWHALLAASDTHTHTKYTHTHTHTHTLPILHTHTHTHTHTYTHTHTHTHKDMYTCIYVFTIPTHDK
jgi:hypothetical protein